jgi:hypothetical protein
MVATAEISPSTNDDDLSMLTESVLTRKLASFAETESAPEPKEDEVPDVKEDTVEDDSTPEEENERTDVDEPRVEASSVEELTEEATADVATAEPTADSEMSDETAEKVLERYAFGAGMRMYARSLALAELAEKEKAAKTLKKAPSSSLAEPKPLNTVPSAKSVLSFESVRSEISRLVQSIGSYDPSTAVNTKTRDLEEEDDDDVVDAITHASEETMQHPTGLCGADEALADLFHQAEIWAEKTYYSLARETERRRRSTKRSYKKWWSATFSRKSGAVMAEKLSLEEASRADTAPSEKPWWTLVLCAPVIVDVDETPLCDDNEEHKATSAEPINEPAASESTNSRWEIAFTGMVQKWFTKKTKEPTETGEAALPEEEDEIPAPDEAEPTSVVDQQQE